MNTNNTLLIIIVVLLVGFGVWYFANERSAAPAPAEENSVIDVDLGSEGGGGFDDDGTPDQGPGDN